MNDIRLRPAQPSDVTIIGELTVQAYHAGQHLEPGDSYEDTLRDVTPRLADTVVAELDGAVVGSVTVCSSGNPTAEISADGEWEFRFLATRPDLWGAGIARVLIAECEVRAAQAGASAIVISVIDSNKRAHQLYQRLDYVRVPERDWSPPQDTSACGVTNVQLLAYRKELPSASSL
jgi:ribosomal protein S18 acetylase RimI-like enzyme